MSTREKPEHQDRPEH